MAETKLLTIRDVSLTLGISEKEVIDLAENEIIPAYKIGGVYLRFKPQQVEEFKKRYRPPAAQKNAKMHGYSFKEKFADFIYFNDFYLFSAVIIIAILIFILHVY